jgi:hypothetical protein
MRGWSQRQITTHAASELDTGAHDITHVANALQHALLVVVGLALAQLLALGGREARGVGLAVGGGHGACGAGEGARGLGCGGEAGERQAGAERHMRG